MAISATPQSFSAGHADNSRIHARTEALYEDQRRRLDCWTDHLFAVMFVAQWVFQIGLALWVSPRTWEGQASRIHPHVWTAVFLGGALVTLPLLLAIYRPGRATTRQVIAVAQGLTSAILIHLTGGRIETHFYVFVSLAILAFYRDWRVLLTMSVVVALDHLVRGIVWPQSVYGTNLVSPWRFLEHSFWVVLEAGFLIVLVRQSLIETWSVAQRQAQLEAINEEIIEGNAQLLQEIAQRKQTQLELEKAKNAAEAASRAKTEFLANMSHELRTPLNAVIGFSDVLVEQVFGPLNENQFQYVTDILESGQHLLLLVNDILDLAKIEAGTIEIQRAPVPVARMVERTVQMFRERAVRHGIRLSGQVDPDVGTIEADERRVKQLLYNLLSNALKFTPSGGDVRVAVSRTSDATVLIVSDTGVGISVEEQERIFESFYQVDSGLSKNAQGTGLGLAVVRQTVELHGGTVRVESEPGQGSSFVVTLPHAVSGEAAAEHDVLSSVAGSHLTSR